MGLYAQLDDLRARLKIARAELSRLASMQTMTTSFVPDKTTAEWRELEARMDYAKAAHEATRGKSDGKA